MTEPDPSGVHGMSATSGTPQRGNGTQAVDREMFDVRSPKFHVKRFLDERCGKLAGTRVVDVPAGTGTTSRILLEHGATVAAFDLFPEYFQLEGVKCVKADVMRGIPMAAGTADMLVCQEGLEHFSDQVAALQEFNRVLKLGGELAVTTPSYSCLSAKLSYMLFEAESCRKMPPNERDDVWMASTVDSREVYFGHLFLTGLQRLRTLASVCGFSVREVRWVRLSKASLALLPLLYPLIVASSVWRYCRAIRRGGGRVVGRSTVSSSGSTPR
jgi:SAM-dependent methyltransferase